MKKYRSLGYFEPKPRLALSPQERIVLDQDSPANDVRLKEAGHFLAAEARPIGQISVC